MACRLTYGLSGSYLALTGVTGGFQDDFNRLLGFWYSSLPHSKTVGRRLQIRFKTHTKNKIPILDILKEFWCMRR